MPYHCLVVGAPEALAAPDAPTSPAALQPHGIRPWNASTRDAALALLRQWRFDAVLIDSDDADRPLPPAWSPLLSRLSREGAPALLLCAGSTGDAALVHALERGIADWMFKPASPALLAAKLRRLAAGARLSRPVDDGQGAQVQVGSLRLDLRRRVACAGRSVLPLAASDYALLALLAAHAERSLTRHAIATALGRTGQCLRGVDNLVCSLRRALETVGDVELQTVRGEGYRLSHRRVADGTAQPMQRETREASLA